MKNLLPTIVIAFTWIFSTSLSSWAFVENLGGSKLSILFAIAVAPCVFFFAFPIALGTISLPFQRGIIRGRFPRAPFHPIYFSRRVYGVCWTQVFYFKPLYSAILAIPAIKAIVLRLFGYRGELDFTVYPDTWIRDLPLLKIGKGAYLANRATLGTNLVLTDGTILVDGISIGEASLVGHLCIIGTGASVGSKSEIGLRTSLGVRTKVLDSVDIKPQCAISHGTVVKNGATVGMMSFIGQKCTIEENINVPPGSNIPAGTTLSSQEDCDRYFSSDISNLNAYRTAVMKYIVPAVSDE